MSYPRRRALHTHGTKGVQERERLLEKGSCRITKLFRMREKRVVDVIGRVTRAVLFVGGRKRIDGVCVKLQTFLEEASR